MFEKTTPPMADPASTALETGAVAPLHRHPDFSRAVLDDLYRYPPKREGLALLFWAVTGLFGGHRFYLERPLTGLLMLFSGGGGGVWWLLDALLLRRMVRTFNVDQARRQASGQPPRALAFMPQAREGALPPAPPWVAVRGHQRQLAGDLLVLGGAGFAVGALAAGSDIYEPVVTILALCGITLLGARWDALAHVPGLRGFDRWSHRLRLFYYVNDPGRPLELLFRPLVALVVAPFRPRARAEVWLYLQLGAWFTVIFTGMDVIESVSFQGGGLALHPETFVADVAMTFASIYAFATPVGAVLTARLLIEPSDRLVWLLAFIALGATLLGLSV